MALRWTVLGLVWVGGLLSAGCGGGGSDETTVVLDGVAALDGSVMSNGAVLTGVGEQFTGDDDGNFPGVGSRQFFSFDLGSLPAGAEIVSATLRLEQEDPDGTPFASHGVVVVDHLDYGGTLDAGDFASVALTANIGTMSTTPTSGARTLDVTAQVESDIAALRTRSQFRLRFSLLDSNNDGGQDQVHYLDVDNAGANDLPPALVVIIRD